MVKGSLARYKDRIMIKGKGTAAGQVGVEERPGYCGLPVLDITARRLCLQLAARLGQ